MRVFTSVGVVITYEGVVLPLSAWFYLCMRGFASVRVDLPLWAWFYICRRGFTYGSNVNLCGRGFTFVGVVSPWRGISWHYLCMRGFYLCRRGYNI